MHKFYLLLLLLFCSYSFSVSQVVVAIQDVPPNYNVNTDNFPLLEMNVRLTDGGAQKELQANEFFILENAMVCEPVSVSPLQGGWQTVTWYTKLTDFTQLGSYSAQLLVEYKNLPNTRFLFGSLEYLPILFVTNGKNQQIRDANWPIVTPGNSVPFQIKIRGYLRDAETLKQYAIRVDSLTTRTSYFKCNWLGPELGEKREPPAEINIDIDYLVNIIFTPDKFGYFQDVLTIHFNNGMKRHVPLYANTFNVDIQRVLKLTEPVKGTALAPCQEVTIKWKGHDPANPVSIYYSTDAGYEWKFIDVVKDSMYKWYVPNIETNFLYFRVRQDFKNSGAYKLSEEGDAVYSVNYNKAGTLLSSLNSKGKILTWDLVTEPDPKILRRHFLEENSPIPEDKFYSFGMEYSGGDNKFYAGYRNYLLQGDFQRDSIAVFNSNQTYPVKKIGLPEGFDVKSMSSDRHKKYLNVFPNYGSKILQYSMANETLVKEIEFEAPIMDIAFNTNSDSAAVLLIDGKIKLVRLDDFTVFDQLNFDIFPNFLEIAYSPNGKFLSIGTQADNSGLKTNIYLIDIATRQIVRVFNPSGGNPLSLMFNPTSTSLLVGSQTDKQIAIYDLTTNLVSNNMFGHSGNMTDLKMSPSGFSIVSTAVSQQDNIMYRTFSYPQEDQSDGYIIIEIPKISANTVKMKDTYLGIQSTETINSICNIGRSPADINDVYFKNRLHFRLPDYWKRDTANAGECFNIDIIFQPLDTGLLRDTIIMTSCTKTYLIPIEAYSIPRNIVLLNNNIDFGEVCIGDTARKDFPLFRNGDPMPLTVNSTLLKIKDDLAFRKLETVKDTVLMPNEVYIAKIAFIPKELGPDDADIIINHSNQSKIFSVSKVKGTGIGSFVDLSHETLRFIPEILTRELKLKNTGVTDVFFDAFRVTPPGAFTVITPAGFNLKPKEEKTIEISWNGTDNIEAQLIIDANPCLIQRFINLGFYKGTSVVQIPTVEAEANDENVRIPIFYTNTENGPYSGKRIFEGEYTVNSKLFLPRSVESKHGTASLTGNNVSNGLRTFGIKVEGDFPLKDTLAVIVGVAGLSDTNRSAILLKESSVAWSRFVNTVSTPGAIIITGICENRYIIRTNQSIQNVLVLPNPVMVNAKIRFDLTNEMLINCDIIDNTGTCRSFYKDIKCIAGENVLDLNLSDYGTGNYKIRLSTGTESVMSNIIILR